MVLLLDTAGAQLARRHVPDALGDLVLPWDDGASTPTSGRHDAQRILLTVSMSHQAGVQEGRFWLLVDTSSNFPAGARRRQSSVGGRCGHWLSSVVCEVSTSTYFAFVTSRNRASVSVRPGKSSKVNTSSAIALRPNHI